MGIRSSIFLGCLLVSLNALSQESIQPAIVRLNGDGSAVLVTQKPVKPSDKVFIQYPDRNSRPRCCKRLSGAAFTAEAAPGVVATNEITGEAPIVSKAKVPLKWAAQPFIGAAGAGALRCATSSTMGGLVLRSRTGQTRKSRTCISKEGFHLMEGSGNRLKTHLYLSLGYEVESPTCRE